MGYRRVGLGALAQPESGTPTTPATQPFTVRAYAPLLPYVVRGAQAIWGANVCLSLSGTRRPPMPALRRLLSPSFAPADGATLALVNADANLLMRLLVRRLRQSNMFRHRTIIKRFFVLLNARAPRLIQGCVLRVRGKISVGGNARSRELEFQVGTFSSGQMILRASTRRGLIGTVTGCLGVYLTLWF